MLPEGSWTIHGLWPDRCDGTYGQSSPLSDWMTPPLNPMFPHDTARYRRSDEIADIPGQYCDLTRQYDPYPSPNTTTGKPDGQIVPKWQGGDAFGPLLSRLGKLDLLGFMNKFWKAQVGVSFTHNYLLGESTSGRA